jgi:hydrogenase maturation protein HypF
MAFSSTSPPPEGRAIRVRGRVQGVGLRPTVWRLARDCGLSGEVWNDAEGVMLRAWGCSNDLDRFLRRLEDEPPPLARIDAIEWVKFDGLPSGNDFRILRSRSGKVHTEIVPDA